MAEYRVGILADAGTLVISRERDVRSVMLNIPRAGRSDTDWRAAKPPDVPYMTRSQRISDVLTYSGPDFVTTAAALNFEAVFGLKVPEAATPDYLLRVTPRTLIMATFALPDDSHGPAVSLYKARPQDPLTVVRQDGTLTTIDYPLTL